MQKILHQSSYRINPHQVRGTDWSVTGKDFLRGPSSSAEMRQSLLFQRAGQTMRSCLKKEARLLNLGVVLLHDSAVWVGSVASFTTQSRPGASCFSFLGLFQKSFAVWMISWLHALDVDFFAKGFHVLVLPQWQIPHCGDGHYVQMNCVCLYCGSEMWL